MVDIIPYQPAHLLKMDLRLYERGFAELVESFERYAQELAIDGLSYSGMLDDVPVACAGICPIYNGVGEAWFIFSPRFEIGRPSRPWASVSMAAKRGLKRAFEIGFHRVQTAIPVDFLEGQRLVRHLGFMSEGPMKAYGPNGEDFMRFARTS